MLFDLTMPLSGLADLRRRPVPAQRRRLAGAQHAPPARTAPNDTVGRRIRHPSPRGAFPGGSATLRLWGRGGSRSTGLDFPGRQAGPGWAGAGSGWWWRRGLDRGARQTVECSPFFSSFSCLPILPTSLRNRPGLVTRKNKSSDDSALAFFFFFLFVVLGWQGEGGWVGAANSVFRARSRLGGSPQARLAGFIFYPFSVPLSSLLAPAAPRLLL